VSLSVARIIDLCTDPGKIFCSRDKENWSYSDPDNIPDAGSRLETDSRIAVSLSQLSSSRLETADSGANIVSVDHARTSSCLPNHLCDKWICTRARRHVVNERCLS